MWVINSFVKIWGQISTLPSLKLSTEACLGFCLSCGNQLHFLHSAPFQLSTEVRPCPSSDHNMPVVSIFFKLTAKFWNQHDLTLIFCLTWLLLLYPSPTLFQPHRVPFPFQCQAHPWLWAQYPVFPLPGPLALSE